MNTSKKTLIAVGVVGALAGGAQTASFAQEVVPLAEWNERDMQPGWSAEQMINLPVRSSGGEEIGEVENLLIGPEGDVQRVILEVGGFLDIGDTHFAVPWDQVEVSGSGELEYLTVPVTEDNYDQFDLSWEAGDVEEGPREFRATELIGDYATFGGEGSAGYVNDLIFDGEGKLQEIVVNQSGAMGGGYRAYPYYGYDAGFEPGMDTYDLPYTEDEIGELEPFDYEPYSGS